MKPVVIDLCCGLGGWSKGFIAEGWEAVGFDIEKHEYGDKRYPGELILRDILTLNGYDLRAVNPALIVASPPCQAYSYRAMPWKRAKALPPPSNELFDACFRIAREAGVPIVVENVRGAQPWVGRAQAHYGSYYLWGDVEGVGGAIVRARQVPKFGEMLRVKRGQKFNPDGTEHGQGSWFAIADSKNRGAQKREGRNFHAFENGLGSSPSFNGAEHETRGVRVPGMNWSGSDKPDYKAVCFRDEGARQQKALKTVGHVNKRDGFEHARHLTNQRESGAIKQHGSGASWFDQALDERRRDSNSRKAASAMIAEIPFELAQCIARVFKPGATL